ncbi:hypothetical protein P7K49_022435 [Saguinus oedipus]|uniref:Uncharacterized protein n=1 Tax=Saguinus oedipus TaxID=9490 RepID=A0ABQ9UVH5_SAGOE|nr:hypothetical protein P7K49_022435 [Saguinus oedipus]
MAAGYLGGACCWTMPHCQETGAGRFSNKIRFTGAVKAFTGLEGAVGEAGQRWAMFMNYEEAQFRGTTVAHALEGGLVTDRKLQFPAFLRCQNYLARKPGDDDRGSRLLERTREGATPSAPTHTVCWQHRCRLPGLAQLAPRRED